MTIESGDNIVNHPADKHRQMVEYWESFIKGSDWRLHGFSDYVSASFIKPGRRDYVSITSETIDLLFGSQE